MDSGKDFWEDQILLPHYPRKRASERPWPWVWSTAIFVFTTAILSVQLYIDHRVPSCSEKKPQAWKRSDFPAAREIIEFEEVQFLGNNAYDEDGQLYIANPPPVDYIGEPSPEIDKAWKDLIGERDFLITPEEAYELWGEERDKYWHHGFQGYLIGLDLFHTLHCLDNLRKLYYPDYYPVPSEHLQKTIAHRGHCIDQIRQHVMCAGDLSPYGSEYFPNPGRNYASSDVVHTCRNFGKIRDWVRGRFHAGGSLHLPHVDVWDTWKNST